MTKLCPRGKAAAKRKFKVYPSAYANAYASKICAGKIKDPSGTKRKDWGPKKASKGASIKINQVASKLEKASKAHAAQAKTLRTINAKDGEYIGSYVKGDLAGKKVSNKSYMQYYKGMIDV
jgi:hypothetical protein|tara:strand:- start:187 stop:549 length:363 start_codon:yes stop_codon:yes gene_type:complete